LLIVTALSALAQTVIFQLPSHSNCSESQNQTFIILLKHFIGFLFQNLSQSDTIFGWFKIVNKSEKMPEEKL
jgi:hypothetical protein